jgi:hypothetical protein
MGMPLSASRLPDPVPLGVAGAVSVSQATYLATGGAAVDDECLVLDDEERVRYIAHRLTEAMPRPLTAPGSDALAEAVLGRFPESDLLVVFAEKALETLRDGRRHDRTAISPVEPRCAVMFVAWYGTHLEVQAERVGSYLDSLAGVAMGIVHQGVPLAAFMEIDAYVRDRPDTGEPRRPLAAVFDVDVEYSYLPGLALGFPRDVDNPLPRAFVINRSLCTPDEAQSFRKLMA